MKRYCLVVLFSVCTLLCIALSILGILTRESRFAAAAMTIATLFGVMTMVVGRPESRRVATSKDRATSAMFYISNKPRSNKLINNDIDIITLMLIAVGIILLLLSYGCIITLLLM